MTETELVLSIIVYILMGVIIGSKQSQCMEYRNERHGFTIISTIFWPIWLLVAIIRQVFFETWH